MSSPFVDPTYGVAGTSPLRDITNLPYILLSNYVQSVWNTTQAYGIPKADVEFDVTPDLNNKSKSYIINFDPNPSPLSEDVDIYEKFTQESHIIDVQIFVKDDALRDTNRMPDKMIDLIRYMKRVLKQSKTQVTDIENVQLVGEGPLGREDLSEWYGYSITAALWLFMVTTV